MQRNKVMTTMGLTLHLKSVLREQILGFPANEYMFKLGQYGFHMQVAEDGKHVTTVLDNIPSNDQFDLFVGKFGSIVEHPNVWVVDLETVDREQFMLETVALLSRMYIDMMVKMMAREGAAETTMPVTDTETTMPAAATETTATKTTLTETTPITSTEF